VVQVLPVRFVILRCALSDRSGNAKRDLDAWYQRLRELWQYKEEYGDCRVTRSYENKQLAHWVRNQRSRIESSAYPLSLDQVDALNQIGFEWSIRTKRTDKGLQSYRSATDAETHSSRPASAVAASHSSSREAAERREIDYIEPASRKRSAQVLRDRSSNVKSGSPVLPRLEPLSREVEAAEAKYVLHSVSTVGCTFLYPKLSFVCQIATSQT
jgi:Helicase associated domain